MNAKSKKTLKAAALTAGLVAVLLPTGCASDTQRAAFPQAPGSPDTVVAPTVQ
jgi:hypothetical protein